MAKIRTSLGLCVVCTEPPYPQGDCECATDMWVCDRCGSGPLNEGEDDCGEHQETFDEIRDIYRSIANVPGATITRGQADVLWLISEVERLEARQKQAIAKMKAAEKTGNGIYLEQACALLDVSHDQEPDPGYVRWTDYHVEGCIFPGPNGGWECKPGCPSHDQESE